MGLLSRMFGVSWGTYRKVVGDLDDMRKAHESVSRGRKNEITLRKNAEERLSEVHGQLSKQKNQNMELAVERDGLNAKLIIARNEYQEAETKNNEVVAVNHQIAKELARVRELFMVPFASDEAKHLALISREVHGRHLQKPSGVRKRYTSRDMVLAVKVAQQEVERAKQEQTEAVASMPREPEDSEDGA